MKPLAACFAPLFACVCPVVFPLQVQAAEPEDSYVRFAKEIPFVYNNFLYGREPWGEDRTEEVVKALKSMDLAMRVEGSFEQFAALADHADPRVRTLALIKLYASGNPEAFRVIQRHQDDQAEGLPKMEIPLGRAGFEKPFFTTAKASVGSYATSMLYMIGYPPVWGEREVGFEAWSKPRLGNPDWIGWYEFRFKVAGQGSRPIQEEAQAQVAAFKQELARCPDAVRAWVWFGVADDFLMSPAYDTPLATEAEMIEAGRKLGPEALLAFLKDGSRAGLREPRIDNPEWGRRFILLHAKQFFREKDAPALAHLGLYTAAADANPKMASELIRMGLAALDRRYQNSERGIAMATLLDLQPGRERDFVVNWFYETPLDPSNNGSQYSFYAEYQRRKPQGWEETAKALVAHPAFERLGTLDTSYLAHLVNTLGGRQVFANELMQRSREIELRNELRTHFGLETVKIRPLETPALPPGKALWTSPLAGRVVALSVSPDGSVAAVGRETGSVLLFDTEEGRPLGELPGADGGSIVQFRKTDGVVLVVSDNGILTEWDAKSRTQLRQVSLGKFPVREAALSGSGEVLASREANEVGISVYDVKAAALRWNSKMPIRAFGMIALSPDGSRLAVADGWANTMLLYDTAKPEPIATLTGHSGVPAFSTFSPDGKLLLSTADDSKIILWDALTGQLLHEYQRTKGYGMAGFSADSKSFLLGTDFTRISLFDAATGEGKQCFETKSNWVQAVVADPRGRKWFTIEVGQGPMAFSPDAMEDAAGRNESCRLSAWTIE